MGLISESRTGASRGFSSCGQAVLHASAVAISKINADRTKLFAISSNRTWLNWSELSRTLSHMREPEGYPPSEGGIHRQLLAWPRGVLA